MRVTNETNWRTDQLKKLAMEVAYRESSLSTEGRKRVKIKFHSGSTRALRGTSTYPGWIRVKVPSLKLSEEDNVPGIQWRLDSPAMVRLAQNLTCGIGVAVGLRGKDMSGLPKYNFSPENIGLWDWVKRFPVEQKVPTPKFEKEVTVETKMNSERLERQKEVRRAEARVYFWERTLQRSMEQLTDWKKRLKRAEKKLTEVQTTVILEPEGKIMTGRKFRKPELEVAEV